MRGSFTMSSVQNNWLLLYFSFRCTEESTFRVRVLEHMSIGCPLSTFLSSEVGNWSYPEDGACSEC